MKKLSFNDLSSEMLNQLRKGAFLTTKVADKVNTMTIGWGFIGYMWNKPCMMVVVRYSRYTYELMEKSKDFSVSVPLSNDLKSQLAFCGSKSGRDMDKIEACNLTLAPSLSINTPIISDCELHYECELVYKREMDPKELAQFIDDKNYPNDCYHVMYYGEIKEIYKL